MPFLSSLRVPSINGLLPKTPCGIERLMADSPEKRRNSLPPASRIVKVVVAGNRRRELLVILNVKVLESVPSVRFTSRIRTPSSMMLTDFSELRGRFPMMRSPENTKSTLKYPAGFPAASISPCSGTASQKNRESAAHDSPRRCLQRSWKNCVACVHRKEAVSLVAAIRAIAISYSTRAASRSPRRSLA